MAEHIGTRQLYPIKGGYYVPAETFVLLQDYEEKDWPDIVSIVAEYTKGYSEKSCLTCEEADTLLKQFCRKAKADLEIDERMQKILMSLIERSPRRIWEIAEVVEPPVLRGRKIIPSPHLRSAIKRMNGTLVMSTKSEVEITETGVKMISKIVGAARVAKAKRDGAAAKAAREQDLQMKRALNLSQSML
ncbi:MAG: hypothetical protein JRN20_05695 [Nitrososphaerota archaeon]|nr:hypothetical protein [Nitrososphaerota archaeon]MDG6922805.1 hypothetical protein [Nitrososphaerota archaeon]